MTATPTTHAPARPAPESPTAPEATDGFRTTGAWLLLLGAVTMIVGAILYYSAGADLDQALADGEIGVWLADAAEHSTQLIWNLGLWTVGAIAMALGGSLLTRTVPHSPAAAISRFGFIVGAAAVVVFFPLWIGLIVGLAGTTGVEQVAVALGQGVTVADWVATTLILVVGGAGLAIAGRDAWVPVWLVRFAFVGVAVGVLAIATLALDAREIGFVVVPVGLAIVISLAVSALRGR